MRSSERTLTRSTLSSILLFSLFFFLFEPKSSFERIQHNTVESHACQEQTQKGKILPPLLLLPPGREVKWLFCVCVVGADHCYRIFYVQSRHPLSPNERKKEKIGSVWFGLVCRPVSIYLILVSLCPLPSCGSHRRKNILFVFVRCLWPRVILYLVNQQWSDKKFGFLK
jgi:hypothetical protein